MRRQQSHLQSYAVSVGRSSFQRAPQRGTDDRMVAGVTVEEVVDGLTEFPLRAVAESETVLVERAFDGREHSVRVGLAGIQIGMKVVHGWVIRCPEVDRTNGFGRQGGPTVMSNVYTVHLLFSMLWIAPL